MSRILRYTAGAAMGLIVLLGVYLTGYYMAGGLQSGGWEHMRFREPSFELNPQTQDYVDRLDAFNSDHGKLMNRYEQRKSTAETEPLSLGEWILTETRYETILRSPNGRVSEYITTSGHPSWMINGQWQNKSRTPIECILF